MQLTTKQKTEALAKELNVTLEDSGYAIEAYSSNDTLLFVNSGAHCVIAEYRTNRDRTCQKKDAWASILADLQEGLYEPTEEE